MFPKFCKFPKSLKILKVLKAFKVPEVPSHDTHQKKTPLANSLQVNSIVHFTTENRADKSVAVALHVTSIRIIGTRQLKDYSVETEREAGPTSSYSTHIKLQRLFRVVATVMVYR